MQNIKRIDEAVGSITERRASAKKLLQMVAKGDSSEVEGIKLSKDMAESYLDWLRMSAYGKKFGDLPFGMLFSASFNWGIERYIGKALKTELKELKAKASEMRKAEKFESKSLDEAIDLLKSTWKGTKGWNDIARIMDAGLKKSIKKIVGLFFFKMFEKICVKAYSPNLGGIVKGIDLSRPISKDHISRTTRVHAGSDVLSEHRR